LLIADRRMGSLASRRTLVNPYLVAIATDEKAASGGRATAKDGRGAAEPPALFLAR
jgi:hypothetical protein